MRGEAEAALERQQETEWEKAKSEKKTNQDRKKDCIR
ncbi:hypothetical protein C818_02667 [Lachnospiraceae bacterium MD308]|nr:hypothetical protein C818_02667 [Lachnospiraceae bacterium MD308]